MSARASGAAISSPYLLYSDRPWSACERPRSARPRRLRRAEPRWCSLSAQLLSICRSALSLGLLLSELGQGPDSTTAHRLPAVSGPAGSDAPVTCASSAASPTKSGPPPPFLPILPYQLNWNPVGQGAARQGQERHGWRQVRDLALSITYVCRNSPTDEWERVLSAKGKLAGSPWLARPLR